QILLGWNWPIRIRKLLGDFCFFYACLHLLTYTVIDQGFDIHAIAKDVLKHKFIFLGMGTWLLLLPLAITSTQGWQRRLGFRRWKRLHRLVYLAGGLASFHFLLRFKTPRLETLAWMGVIGALLLVRAVEAVHTGALDYVTKDFSPPELIARIRKTLAQLRAGRELERLHDVEATHVGRPMVLGTSPRMRAVVQVAEKIAAKPVTVLVTGESGTGKEVLARYIHARSDRRTSPFVAVNLPAIPANLVESELFGHERGSFTGADRQKLGKFELANGGTLFLDEIGDLALDLQAKILRALQEHEIERVGGEKPILLDLRVICATNRELAKLVQEGRFREDLFWRLKVVPIELPPLRERREDI